jgi:prevent-host-death family protein
MDNTARTRVSQSEAKQRLGEIVKRVAYGGERIVLEFRGKPQAAIVSIADLEALESARDARALKVSEPVAEYVAGSRTRLEEIKLLPEPERTLRILDELRVFARRAGERAARLGIKSDVARDIEEMREERDDYLAGLS